MWSFPRMCCKSVWQILLWTPEYPSGQWNNDLRGKETINQSISNIIKDRKMHTLQTQISTVPAKTWHITNSWSRAARFRLNMVTIRQRHSDWKFTIRSWTCLWLRRCRKEVALVVVQLPSRTEPQKSSYYYFHIYSSTRQHMWTLHFNV